MDLLPLPPEDDFKEYFDDDLDPASAPKVFLVNLATFGVTLLSLAFGVGAGFLAFSQLLRTGQLAPTLNVAGFPLAFSWMLRGFLAQVLLYVLLQVSQCFRQAAAVRIGMAFTGLLAGLLLLIRLTT